MAAATQEQGLLGVGSHAWFSDDAPQHPAWTMYRLASPRLRPDGTADRAHDVTPTPRVETCSTLGP